MTDISKTPPPTSSPSSVANINRSMAAGAVWMIGMRLSVTGLGILSMVVLARLLTPSDFGLVALATSVVAGLEVLTNFRFDVALIQNQSATRSDYDSAWTLNLLLGGALGALLCVAALPAASFFAEPRLVAVVVALAVVALVDGAQNIGTVNFRKDLAFGREFALTIIRKLAGVIVAVACAWMFRSYWALAAGIVTASIGGLVASYAMHPYRPRLCLTAARRLIGFSGWLVLENVLAFLRNRSGDFLIGKLAGTGPLGAFNLASEVASLAQATLTAPINRAILPGYSRLAADPALLRESYFSVIAVTTLTAVPAAIIIAAVAPLLVPLALGERWLASIPLIEMLGIASAVSLTCSGGAMVYLALGRPRLLIALGIVHVVVLLVGMAVLLPRWGLEGAAWAVLFAAVANVPVQLALVHRVLGRVLGRWVSAVWRPVISAGAMYAIVTDLVARGAPGSSLAALFTNLLGAIGAGIVSYVGVDLLLWLFAGRPAGAESNAFSWAREIVVARTTNRRTL